MDPLQQKATERWFVHRGLPHAIADYSATQDVFTRAAPFLGFVLFVEVFTSFDDRFEGWAQVAAFFGGIGVLLAALVGLNRLRHRRPLQLPDQIGAPELAFFVLVPALLPVLFSNDRSFRFVSIIAINLVVLGVAYVVTAYGLLPALRVGAIQVIRQISQVTQLVARGLPLLLLFSVFVFLNAEMWQVAHDFHPAYYAIVVPALVLLALAFVVLRLPREINTLNRFSSWNEICSLAADTDAPIANCRPADDSGTPPQTYLGRVDHINVGLLLVAGQVVQVLLIGLIIGLFYVGFGLLAVREDTILQWTTAQSLDPIARFEFLNAGVVLTWELLAVAGFIGAFSSLQFAVTASTDSAMREEFTEHAITEVREILAVRALYNCDLADPRGGDGDPVTTGSPR